MKLKKYGKGGKYAMYQNGGPVKAKKMSKEEREKELTKMSGVAKERLEELAGEKAYLKKRAEADRAYKSALKDGATEEQATKLAEKYLGGFKDGGKVKPKKKITKVDPRIAGLKAKGDFYQSLEPEYKKIYEKHLDDAINRGVSVSDAASSAVSKVKKAQEEAEQAKKNIKNFVGDRKYLKGGQVKLDANKDGKISGEDFKILKAKKK